jgi:ribosomal-protein-alanine N-acetyltransferase
MTLNILPITGEFPKLETDRLILRQMTLEDVPALFKIWSDPEVTKYINITAFKEESQAREMIELLNRLAEEKKAIRWAITLKEDQKVIGSGGFNTWLKEEAFRGEIGYDLDRGYWGRGIMTEVLRALISFGFGPMKLNRIEAMVEPENIASIKLLKKNGFWEEGLLREYQVSKEKFIDLQIFSLLKREYNLSV